MKKILCLITLLLTLFSANVTMAKDASAPKDAIKESEILTKVLPQSYYEIMEFRTGKDMQNWVQAQNPNKIGIVAIGPKFHGDDHASVWFVVYYTK